MPHFWFQFYRIYTHSWQKIISQDRQSLCCEGDCPNLENKKAAHTYWPHKSIESACCTNKRSWVNLGGASNSIWTTKIKQRGCIKAPGCVVPDKAGISKYFERRDPSNIRCKITLNHSQAQQTPREQKNLLWSTRLDLSWLSPFVNALHKK